MNDHKEEKEASTQRKSILELLQFGYSLTSKEALDALGCGRLAARVLELRRMGYPVKTVMESRGRKRYARYILEVE